MERVRAFIQHYYFAEAIVAFLAFMASWWSPSLPIKIAFGFLGAILLVVAIVSKIRNDRAQRAEHDRLQRTIRTLTGNSRKQPIVQVAYAWQTSEPKEKPFTITNAGMFGATASVPVINYPEVGILGVHLIEERPVVRDHRIVVRWMMTLVLSFDHRLVDGTPAVQFLARVKELLEDPESWLLDSI